MFKFVFCFLGLATVVLPYSLPRENVRNARHSSILGQPVLQNFLWIGKVGNKNYVIETSGNMNHTDAKAMCEFEGFTLGTVETDEEYDFLNSSLVAVARVPDFYFWTAAQDFQDRSQLRWYQYNGMRTEITGKMEVRVTEEVTPQLTSGILTAANMEPLFMAMVPCSYQSRGGNALCQLIREEGSITK